MKPAELILPEQEKRVAVDPSLPVVWLGFPTSTERTDALVFDHVSARALGYALLSAADAARFPKKKE